MGPGGDVGADGRLGVASRVPLRTCSARVSVRRSGTRTTRALALVELKGAHLREALDVALGGQVVAAHDHGDGSIVTIDICT